MTDLGLMFINFARNQHFQYFCEKSNSLDITDYLTFNYVTIMTIIRNVSKSKVIEKTHE